MSNNYITELYKDLESKYKPGFFDWLEAHNEKYMDYQKLVENLEKSMKTDNTPAMEYHGGVYKNFMLALLSEFEAALKKAKVQITLDKLRGRLNASE